MLYIENWINEKLKTDFEIYPPRMCMILDWCVVLYLCIYLSVYVSGDRQKERKKKKRFWEDGGVIQIAGNFLRNPRFMMRENHKWHFLLCFVIMPFFFLLLFSNFAIFILCLPLVYNPSPPGSLVALRYFFLLLVKTLKSENEDQKC